MSILNDDPCSKFIEHLEAIRAIEVSAIPSWVLNERYSVKIKERFSQLFKLKQLGIINPRLYFLLEMDLLISMFPDKIKEIYWLTRYKMG